MKEKYGSPFGYGVYFRGGMGAEAIRELLGCGRPRDRGQVAARDHQDLQGPEALPGGQAPQGGGGLPAVRQPAGVDDPPVDPGHPAGTAAHGAARRRPLRHLRPQRSLPPGHQPEQPPQAAARPGRARDHRQQREAHAAGSGRRPVRQRPARPRRHRPGQPAAQVALRHAQGQAGPFPPEPAGQARGLLRPFGHRGRPGTQAAPMRHPQDHGPGAVQALRHEPPGGAQAGAEHQGGQEAGGERVHRGVGHPRRGDLRASGHAEPGPDAAPSGHPGLRAGAHRGQSHPAPSAGLHGLQRRLRRRPDGRPPAALGGGAGRGPHPHAVVQQHPVAGPRPSDSRADPGHDPGLLLPDLLRGPRSLAKIDPFDEKDVESSGHPSASLRRRGRGRARVRRETHRHPGSRPLPLGRRAPAHHCRPGLLQLRRGRVLSRSTSARDGSRQGRKAPSAGTTTSSRTRSSPRTRCRPS